MGYLLLAVVFYTVVKYGYRVWLEFFSARQADERDYGFGHDILVLQKRVAALEKTTGTEYDVDLG